MAPAVFDTHTYQRRLQETRIELVRRHPYLQYVSEVNVWLIVFEISCLNLIYRLSDLIYPWYYFRPHWHV
jgi:hypothetical protein